MAFAQAIAKSFRQHLHFARSYPLAMTIVLATVVEAFYFGYVQHAMRHAIGYVFAVWFCAFVTDVVVNIRPKPAIGFPIKRLAAQESAVILGCTLIGAVFLVFRFSAVWQTAHGLARLSLVSLLVLFTYPIALALIYFVLYRYKPGQLGFNLRYWYLPLLIHPIWGGITMAVAPEQSHWHSFIQQRSFIGALVAGIISAALPEEFTRMLLQTRLGSAFRNKGMGFVAATFIWACLHIPVFRSVDPNADLLHVIVGSWIIMPIGFLWGYMTHRTKSLLPAVLVHGLNLWGLQNF